MRGAAPPVARAYVPLEVLGTRPHVIVDGAARNGTALSLSHWPGTPTPPDLGGDTSTEIALFFLAAPAGRAETVAAVTCDHLDEDGALALFCLCAPERAVEHGALVVAAAAAGDFDTVTEPDAGRVAFALRHLFDPARSPLRATRARWTAAALRAALEELPGLLEAPGAYASWWGAEDAAYDAGRLALASGAVSVEVDGELGLAVVTGAPPATPGPFARVGRALLPVSRAALHSATSAPRVLVATGGVIAYYDRYETWVRYRSRPLPRRRDLAPLASVLCAAEPGDTRWVADPPSALVPVLAPAGGSPSGLALEEVRDLLAAHLRSAPPAWSADGPAGLSGPGAPTGETSGRGPAPRRGRRRPAPSA